MIIQHLSGGERRPVPGPGDLRRLGPGDVVLVSGSPDWRGHDPGRWAPAIGDAVLRGASVRRLP